jgi:hypothetical protein
VSTSRCRRCGYLESFALDEPNTAAEAQTRSQLKVVLIVLMLITAVTLAIAGGVLLTR